MTVIAEPCSNNLKPANPAVGLVLPSSSLAELSADELERHITSCGELMLAAYGRYEVSSDLQDRAEADMWRITQRDAIACRKTGWIVAMEAQRGLR